MYASRPFAGGVEARAVLESSLSDKAVADRAAVEAAIAAGASAQDAVAPYLDEQVFDQWLSALTEQLKAAAATASKG